jgi:hypothetical protein
MGKRIRLAYLTIALFIFYLIFQYILIFSITAHIITAIILGIFASLVLKKEIKKKQKIFIISLILFLASTIIYLLLNAIMISLIKDPAKQILIFFSLPKFWILGIYLIGLNIPSLFKERNY